MSDWDNLDKPVRIDAVPINKAIASKVATSLEEQNIIFTKDTTDHSDIDDEISTTLSNKVDTESESEEEEAGDIVVASDFTKNDVNLIETLNRFTSKYDNIISEFADVEIFLISLDGLLIEFTAHSYLNWTLGGQTIVIAEQIKVILKQLSDLGGKFKLVWFTDLAAVYAKDTVLHFLRSFVAAYLLQCQWASDIEHFANPSDQNWLHYVHELTPSFLMIGVDDVSENVVAETELGFKQLLASIALQSLAAAIPVVYFNGLVVNLCSLHAHRIEPHTVDFKGWENYLDHLWSDKKFEFHRNVDLSSCKSVAQLWAQIIGDCKKRNELPKESDMLASAVLISTLICERRGTKRRYLPESRVSKRGIDFIKFRRILLNSCASLLDSLDLKKYPLSFPLMDLWDGLLITRIYDTINSGAKILPYRIQQELAPLHKIACLELSLEVDTEDVLFDPVVKEDVNFKHCPLLPLNCTLLDRYIPEMQNTIRNYCTEKEPSVFDEFFIQAKWRFDAIEEPYTKPDERPDTAYQMKKQNKSRQKLSKWYELFAESLEGRGTSLLVDFSRTPRGFAAKVDEQVDKKKEKQQWQQKGKGGPKGKGVVKSKKELILEANRSKKNEKLVEDEKNMVRFALQQGKNAMFILENLMNKLELDGSRAICLYQQVIRMADEFSVLEGRDMVEKRRVRAVPIINKLKDLFTVYWQHLDDKQKEYLTDLWVSLGFEKSKKPAAFSEGRLTLNMNMIYYQLAYGGEIIDIQSDPQKDDRVTGFHPDAWQRQMLDAVDRNHSAVIIAPTSAGKTFVSYYCIERVLRQSDEDMVVYVSPSKALLNQVCGSVYARFRNKTLSGGKSLFGTLTLDFYDNPMNCQVLITVPECFENLLLSPNPTVQAMVGKIKYVIFDEVHSISASPDAHIWEHLLLLIGCPFLALSATIGNATVLHKWLQSAEKSKSMRGKPLGEVELITYGERYSELELAMQRISAVDNIACENGVVEHFMPYGVYKPVKLSMFGIPDDQQLTARQIFDLYHALAEVDPVVKEQFEPCKFFNYKLGGEKVWLTRADIRRLETGLKNRFLEWLQTDPEKANKVLQEIGKNVEDELEFRSRPFDQRATAMKIIAPLILELRDKELLPAICFNEDRRVCEKLAEQLFDYLHQQQKEFEASPEYKKYEIKDEERIAKLAKRKRDAAASKEKKKSKATDKFERAEEEDHEHKDQDVDDYDPLAAMKLRLNMVLERFKLRGRQRDEDLYEKMTERMARLSGRETTKTLLKLFERGIGFHHPGLASVERGAVEVLFRSGYLAIIFSTSTLALGINMPCKTVLFGVDNANLTPLQFRQMSGRAGRRGFDHSGTVIFMSIPTAKIRRLLTASLSTLRGNLPFTTSYILRLFGYVHQQDSVISELRSANQKFSPLESRLRTALSLLRNSFVLHTRSEMSSEVQEQLKLYTLFSVQLLRSLSLLNHKGELSGLASLVCQLSADEPGNLIFAHLLQNGAFHKLCEGSTMTRTEVKNQLVLIFAHLFTNLRLPLHWDPNDKNSYPSTGESEVFLKPLPDNFAKLVKQYNKKVETLYREFMRMAGPNNSLQGEVFSLAGNDDSSVSMYPSNIVHPLHDHFLFDEAFMPARPLNPVDHRGRKVYLNAYAVDFWHLESKKALERDNGISENKVWGLIHNFSVTLLKIKGALLVIGRSRDPFVEVMQELADEYDKKFHVAFMMKQRTRITYGPTD